MSTALERHLREELEAYKYAIKLLVLAKDGPPERLRELVEDLEEYGPRGPVGLGPGEMGGHAIGE